MELIVTCFILSTILGWLSYQRHDFISEFQVRKLFKILKLLSNLNVKNNKRLNVRKIYLIFIVTIQLVITSIYIYFIYIKSSFAHKLTKLELVIYYFSYMRYTSDLIVYNILMIYGMVYSETLATLLLKYVELSKSELKKSRLSNKIFILFLILCFTLIPFEILILSLASIFPNIISTQHDFDVIVFLQSYTLKYLIILASFSYCALFHMLVTTESEKIVCISQSIMKFTLENHRKTLNDAENKRIIFSQFLKTLKELRYYHIKINKFFAFPLFFVLFFGIICIITELFYLSFLSNITLQTQFWSFITVFHSISFFIPLVAAPSIAMYQVRYFYIFAFLMEASELK